jgi:hypothetical protein
VFGLWLGVGSMAAHAVDIGGRGWLPKCGNDPGRRLVAGRLSARDRQTVCLESEAPTEADTARQGDIVVHTSRCKPFVLDATQQFMAHFRYARHPSLISTDPRIVSRLHEALVEPSSGFDWGRRVRVLGTANASGADITDRTQWSCDRGVGSCQRRNRLEYLWVEFQPVSCVSMDCIWRDRELGWTAQHAQLQGHRNQ